MCGHLTLFYTDSVNSDIQYEPGLPGASFIPVLTYTLRYTIAFNGTSRTSVQSTLLSQ